jgi:selenocysteine lyase/cysteine desulfurase
MVGVTPERVAVGATVSELVGLVAGSVEPGRIIAPDGEYTSLLWPWLARGFELVSVPLDRVAEAIDSATSVVAVSAVQSSTGELVDLEAVAGAAAEQRAFLVVDATQACGWLPVDASRVDALACAGYKWLCTPRGTAYLTLSDSLLDRIVPSRAGWFAGEDPYSSYYGAPLRLASSARRFDTSPAWFSWVAAPPTLELLLEIGIGEIRSHDVALANRFRAGLGLPAADSPIVKVELPEAASRLERAGVRAATRAGSVRASFHVYTTEADVDAALSALVG